ncbi:MAG: gamma-glutamyltransferase [Eubacteriales bacterium]|nr:gamma-glutamyltransferase [Eubacteriales bacterium]
MKKILALLLSVIMVLSACQPKSVSTNDSTNATTQVKLEEETKEVISIDDNYSSLDDFVLWNEDGTLRTTGRGDKGANGVVSSGKYEASKIGREILEQGGNAVDAAVAVGFALGLTEANATGIGGGGFMTMHSAETGETVFLNFREKAPNAATPEMWQTQTNADGKTTVIGNQKQKGGKSVGVPGNVAGWIYAFENYGSGKLTLKQILQPTIDLAKKGFNVSPTLSTDMKNTYDDLLRYSESGDIFLKDIDGMKLPYEYGEIFKNPDYAKTLELIARDGKDAFYKGEIAKAIIDANSKYGGVMTLEDLANYEVEVTKPVHGTYRGYDIYSSPSPSSGGTIVVQILNILENFDIPSLQYNSPEKLKLLADAFAMAYADRGEYMGDTKFVKVPIDGLTSKNYAKKLSQKIVDGKALNNVMPDDPWMFEHEDTTHYSVADKDGNIVSCTSTVNYYFGSCVAPTGYGFILNDEMDDFVVGADHPNSIAGGKTPLSSMSPTIIMKDGKPFACIGSPGGVNIIAAIAQICSYLIDHNMDMQEAVDAPRIKGYRDCTLDYEGRFPEETINKMVEYGFTMNRSDEFNRSFGSVNAVKYDNDGMLDGAGDPRRDGKALAY